MSPAGLMLFVAALTPADESPFLEQARSLKGIEGARLMELARVTLDRVVEDGDMDPALPKKETPAPFGVFVTLVKRGTVRGCYGSMEPSGKTLEQLVVEAALGASRFDPRSKPLRGDELAQVQIIISIVGPTVPVVTMSEVDPKIDGLMVRAGDRKSVLLPGEARTGRWQLKKNLRQAGIRRGQSYEKFRFRTVTIYEKR